MSCRTDDTFEPSINWDHTEQKFIGPAKGDVLTIMDACFAGNVSSTYHRNYESTYEYLGACQKDQPTSSPGDKSFTAALITSLKQLLGCSESQSFTTADLFRTIAEQRYRKNNPPLLASRVEKSDRRILLAPKLSTEQKKYFDDAPVPTYLDLRIEIKQDGLNRDEVEDLAKRVARAVRQSTVETRRIDWLRLASRKTSSFKTVARSMLLISALGRSRRDTLQTVQEEDTAEKPIHKPGIWATFGIFTPWRHFHAVTLSLERPWTGIVTTGIGVVILVGVYFRWHCTS